MGANIKGAGTDVVRIMGVPRLHGCSYTVIPDQIETGTLMIAAAATGGDVWIQNVIPMHMDSISAKLMEMGVYVEEGEDSIRVSMQSARAIVLCVPSVSRLSNGSSAAAERAFVRCRGHQHGRGKYF